MCSNARRSMAANVVHSQIKEIFSFLSAFIFFLKKVFFHFTAAAAAANFDFPCFLSSEFQRPQGPRPAITPTTTHQSPTTQLTTQHGHEYRHGHDRHGLHDHDGNVDRCNEFQHRLQLHGWNERDGRDGHGRHGYGRIMQDHGSSIASLADSISIVAIKH